MATNVSHVSFGISHTSISMSLGCMEKSENKSSSGGNNDAGISATDFSFSSRMYCSILPMSLKYSWKAFEQYSACSLVKFIL